MDSSRWLQIEEIFDHAIKLKADERAQYLANVWAQDPSLREEIESLITSYEEDPAFLQNPAFDKGLKVLADEPVSVFPGDRVGSYRIISKLGSGGMGSVHLALDSRLGRKVAIKFLSSNLVEDRHRVNRFRQEARAASKISHPNVAAIYEIDSSKATHYIAMEFVDGITLRERLSQRNISLKEALDIAIQVGLAIESAHALGIIHRDIKPENIMIRNDGYVKVLDFGLAKLTEAYQHNPVQISTTNHSITTAIPTEPGFLMGTAMYMSPEQARGQNVDARTDIWSWGVVLYEMVAGDTPFHGATNSDLLADILRGEPALLVPELSMWPEPLKEILRRSLAKDRESRYASINDAIVALRRFQKVIENDPSLGADSSKPSELPETPRGEVTTAQQTVAADTNPQVDGNQASQVHWWRQSFNQLSEKIREPSSRRRVSLIAVGLGVAIFVGTVFMVKQMRKPETRIPQLQFTRLSNEGIIREAVISPDGKYIASIVDEAGSRSLWIRQTHAAATLQILAPSQSQYGALAFSPDGNNIYYIERKAGLSVLYVVSALGGIPRKLLENVSTPITFSPDGTRMAFVRPYPDFTTALITTRPDGTDEKTVAALKGSDSFYVNWQYSTGPVWSPDGELIACPTLKESVGSRVDIVGVRVKDGVMERINANEGLFARVSRLEWLANGRGLILTAKDELTSPFQLWSMSFPKAEIRNLTNDGDNYLGLSTTRDSKTLLTTRRNDFTSLWIVNAGSQMSQIASTNHDGIDGISWTGNGRIIYTRGLGAASELWVMNRDGSNRQQLTFDGQRNTSPTISPDGRYIVFVSYREGKPHLWRASADGTGSKQLTNGSFEDMPTFSKDGNSVIFHRLEPDGIWKVPIEGGEPILLSNHTWAFPRISPDGKVVALVGRKDQNSTWQIILVSAEDGQTINTFTLPTSFTPSLPGLQWTPDGLEITFVMRNLKHLGSASFRRTRPPVNQFCRSTDLLLRVV